MDPNAISPLPSSPSSDPDFNFAVSPATPQSERSELPLDGVTSLSLHPDEDVTADGLTRSESDVPERRHTDMGMPGLDFAYTVLPSPKITSEINRLSSPRVLNDGTLYTVSMQPSQDPKYHNQDRVVTEEWDLESGKWRFRAVFDGHANGDETVDYVYTALPSQIKSHLQSIPTSEISQDSVSSILRKAITAIDDSILEGILSVFPTVESIEKCSDEEIKAIVNDGKDGERGSNNLKMTRGMRGTTVLVVLIGPEGGIWTASLGDCQAVLGTKQPSGEWTATLLSSNHNATENDEVERLRAEHPGEEDVVSKQRVLGLIAVTRAIGDFLFKLPSIYTTRVFANTLPGFARPPSHFENTIKWCLTPPYVSNKADVRYTVYTPENKACLIMCSDGLIDLYAGEGRNDSGGKFDMNKLGEKWVGIVGGWVDSRSSFSTSTSPSITTSTITTTTSTSPSESSESSSAAPSSESASSTPDSNISLHLLREGMGGSNIDKVSSWLTLEYDGKWMDDTSVVVEVL